MHIWDSKLYHDWFKVLIFTCSAPKHSLNQIICCCESNLKEPIYIGRNEYWRTFSFNISCLHYSDVIMSTMMSQITGVSIVCSTVCPGADQRKHQSSASLACVRGIHLSPMDSLTRASNTENVSIWWRHLVSNGVHFGQASVFLIC